jgi:hypothetical protein
MAAAAKFLILLSFVNVGEKHFFPPKSFCSLEEVVTGKNKHSWKKLGLLHEPVAYKGHK